MKLLNLTPHDIVVVVNGTTINIPKSGIVTRVSSESKVVDTIDYEGNKIPVYTEVYGEVNFLDEEGKIVDLSTDLQSGLIMSRLAADAFINLPRYKDIKVYVPGKLIRNVDGQVVGCEGLTQLR